MKFGTSRTGHGKRTKPNLSTRSGRPPSTKYERRIRIRTSSGPASHVGSACTYREPDLPLDLDGIGSAFSEEKVVSVIFCCAKGDRAIVVEGFDTLDFFGCDACGVAEETPWEGKNAAVEAPSPLFDEIIPIVGGVVAVRIDAMEDTAGNRLVTTPP